MYIASWEEFSQRAKALFQAAPDRARYCIRYNHSGSKLVIKVTDDSKVCDMEARCFKHRSVLATRARMAVLCSSAPMSLLSTWSQRFLYVHSACTASLKHPS